MSIANVPMTLDELERMRVLLRKADVEKLPLSHEEEEELRNLVSKGEPEEAKNATLGVLIFLGLALLGLYVSILLLDKTNKPAPSEA